MAGAPDWRPDRRVYVARPDWGPIGSALALRVDPLALWRHLPGHVHDHPSCSRVAPDRRTGHFTGGGRIDDRRLFHDPVRLECRAAWVRVAGASAIVAGIALLTIS